MTSLGRDRGSGGWQRVDGGDAQVKEGRELGVRRNSPTNIEVIDVWVERWKGTAMCRVERNIKVLSKCSTARKSWREARGKRTELYSMSLLQSYQCSSVVWKEDWMQSQKPDGLCKTPPLSEPQSCHL